MLPPVLRTIGTFGTFGTIGTIGIIATLALALTACGRQVAVLPPPDPPAACTQAVEALPDAVDGAGRRPTTPPSAATAAWGEPPIVLRCGVARPVGLTDTSVLLEVDGIGWLPEPLEAGTLFTAVDYPGGALEGVFIEVAVPDAYASPGGVVADIGSAWIAAGLT